MTHPADLQTSELERLVTDIVNQGSSGRGNSFYAGAAECGRRQYLLERKRATYEHLADILPVERHKFLVGSVYHALQQLEHAGELHDAHRRDAATAAFKSNENLRDGWRLFEGWHRYHGRDFWGETVAIEEQIPNTPDAVQSIFKWLGNKQYTARIDLVVRITAADLPRIQKRVPDLRVPGIYLLDWKTRDTHGSPDAYLNGLQALTYPWLYNLQHPEAPCQGIIWDIVIKHSRRKIVKPVAAEDFDACYVSTMLTHRDPREIASEIYGMVEQGARNFDMRIPNRAACASYTGELCQFRKSGECSAAWK